MTVVTSGTPDVETLQRCSANLTRSFALCAVMFVVRLVLPAMIRPTYTGGGAIVLFLLGLTAIGAYIWYAIAAGRAAKLLGDRGWLYVAWILAAPILAVILARLPLIPTLITVSPLSIKFLLGNQLDAAVREATTTSLHRT